MGLDVSRASGSCTRGERPLRASVGPGGRQASPQPGNVPRRIASISAPPRRTQNAGRGPGDAARIHQTRPGQNVRWLCSWKSNRARARTNGALPSAPARHPRLVVGPGSFRCRVSLLFCEYHDPARDCPIRRWGRGCRYSGASSSGSTYGNGLGRSVSFFPGCRIFG